MFMQIPGSSSQLILPLGVGLGTCMLSQLGVLGSGHSEHVVGGPLLGLKATVLLCLKAASQSLRSLESRLLPTAEGEAISAAAPFHPRVGLL